MYNNYGANQNVRCDYERQGRFTQGMKCRHPAYIVYKGQACTQYLVIASPEQDVKQIQFPFQPELFYLEKGVIPLVQDGSKSMESCENFR